MITFKYFDDTVLYVLYENTQSTADALPIKSLTAWMQHSFSMPVTKDDICNSVGRLRKRGLVGRKFRRWVEENVIEYGSCWAVTKKGVKWLRPFIIMEEIDD